MKLPDDKKEQIIAFIDEHSDAYDESVFGARYYAERLDDPDFFSPSEIVPFSVALKKRVTSGFEDPSINNAYLNQLYSWFDVFPEGVDPYEQLLDQYELLYGPLKGKNIVEIGGGMVPALARKMSKRMSDENSNIIGSITVYDPNLIIDYPNVTCIKEKFTDETKVEKDAFLIGMLPCEGTKIMITKMNVDKIKGMIQLCNCHEARGITLSRAANFKIISSYNWFYDSNINFVANGNEFDSGIVKKYTRGN